METKIRVVASSPQIAVDVVLDEKKALQLLKMLKKAHVEEKERCGYYHKQRYHYPKKMLISKYTGKLSVTIKPA